MDLWKISGGFWWTRPVGGLYGVWLTQCPDLTWSLTLRGADVFFFCTIHSCHLLLIWVANIQKPSETHHTYIIETV